MRQESQLCLILGIANRFGLGYILHSFLLNYVSIYNLYTVLWQCEVYEAGIKIYILKFNRGYVVITVITSVLQCTSFT